MAAADSTYRIERLDQFEALASPVRSQILWRLASIGPATVAEVAEAIGRKPQPLYPHFECLREVGLILEQPSAPGSGRGACFVTPARNMVLVYDSSSEAKRQALWDTVAAGNRNAMRSLQRRLLDGNARTHGPDRDTYYSTLSGWVNARELEQINHHLNAIQELLQRPRPDQGMLLMACMAALYQVNAGD